MKEEVDRLWRRVGLAELRDHLENIHSLTRRFEEALQALPSCNECARAVMLEQIRETGNQLSSEVVPLSVLAETLKDTVKAAEGWQSELAQNPPHPCRCEGDKCSCHGGR